MHQADNGTLRKNGPQARPAYKALAAVGGSLTAAGLTLLFGSFLMRLWNRIRRGFFGLPAVGARDAYELRLLLDVLSRIRRGPSRRRPGRKHEAASVSGMGPKFPAASGLPAGRKPYYAGQSAAPLPGRVLPSAWQPDWISLTGAGARQPSLN